MEHVQNAIHIDKLCKSFGDKEVLSNLCMDIPLGKVTCLMGPSGCGKTTLLRILLGLESADKGEIIGLPRTLRCLFQEDRLCEDFSARSNIRIAAPHLSPSQIDAHLAALGLQGEEKAPVRTLSGGMKRRVALARAVAAPSDMLLLDEPFKGLDESAASVAADYLLRHQNGRTFLVVTHEKEDIVRLGAHTLILPERLS